MVMLDGTYDGGGDDLNDDFSADEVDYSDSGSSPDGDGCGFDYPQQEDYENDADNYESHQLSLDNECDYGGDDY